MRIIVLLQLLFQFRNPAVAWVSSPRILQSRSVLSVQKRSSVVDETKLDDEDSIIPIEGAQFFGGNKQKEEFFDPVAEAQAGLETRQYYDRFADTLAFQDAAATSVARSVQQQINRVLYEEEQSQVTEYSYKPSMEWKTSFPVKEANPLMELKNALAFYEHMDVAITSAKSISSNTIEVRWEIAVTWPIFWEPRLLFTGQSILSIDGSSITRQVDTLDEKDLLVSVAKQIFPRFWDIYHIGMTPSAELSPRFPQSSLLKSYNVYELPARLYLQPTQLDTGKRSDNTAAMIPNHAFTCIIKTMGPQKQRYVPTSPVEVKLISQGDGLQIQWHIPLAVEFASQATLALPDADEEAEASLNPACGYKWKESRKVATVPYGGSPQDEEIANIRKQLYNQVIKDGLKPRMENGRPVFFFWMNSVKACYTSSGLGMGVYDWRPTFVKANEVGIELE
ncbi:hypothetical protein FisN_24Lh222 [Fistulifera solaris]|uniref:Uncharacterized protein n=1 Tax=Fistulifera solaris TaxID=1519565 RepID=A0A1Z5K9I6_FISSO|nr:hypothetical protein FisN_24Lh222 [Fistulifera solaris]|eukprot:GAX22933.1 hypothetical protein FisN_24Lh222 [Fistulifera solaris]